ncbi:MAG: hypothetical protein AAFX06_10225 [Planctomycetota bacterium]
MFDRFFRSLTHKIVRPFTHRGPKPGDLLDGEIITEFKSPNGLWMLGRRQWVSLGRYLSEPLDRTSELVSAIGDTDVFIRWVTNDGPTLVYVTPNNRTSTPVESQRDIDQAIATLA